jgi:hypothetical protein
MDADEAGGRGGVTADIPKFQRGILSAGFFRVCDKCMDPYRCPDQKVASSTETRACCYRWKIAVNRQGLAPYGTPKYEKIIRDNLIDLKPDGSFRLNLDYFTIAPA